MISWYFEVIRHSMDVSCPPQVSLVDHIHNHNHDKDKDMNKEKGSLMLSS